MLADRRLHSAVASAVRRQAFTGRLVLSDLAQQPLEEFRRRSEARGLCDATGQRLPGAPWAFQLAHSQLSPFPVIRSVGFQQVSSDSFTFLLRRRPDSETQLPISACYVEGLYESGDVCEQWRVEGIAVAKPASDVIATAPKTSLATILAVDKRSGSARTRLNEEERDELRRAAADQQARLTDGSVGSEEVDRSVIVYAVSPVRVELLVGSPDHGAWERVEWRRDVGSGLQSRAMADGPWGPPNRLAPY